MAHSVRVYQGPHATCVAPALSPSELHLRCAADTARRKPATRGLGSMLLAPNLSKKDYRRGVHWSSRAFRARSTVLFRRDGPLGRSAVPVQSYSGDSMKRAAWLKEGGAKSPSVATMPQQSGVQGLRLFDCRNHVVCNLVTFDGAVVDAYLVDVARKELVEPAVVSADSQVTVG